MSLVARVISNHRPPSPTPLTIYVYMHYTKIYIRSLRSSLLLLPCFIQSRPLSFVSVSRVLLWNTNSRARIVPWRPRHFVKSIPRILRKRDRGAEWEISSEQILVRGYIFTNVPHSTISAFFPPLLSSLLLLVIPSGTFPNPLSLSLSVSAAANSGFHSFFFFFVSFCRHRLSVTHCPSAATMCSVLQNCTRYVKRKNFGVQTRNTLVAVLKRVFPRFRSYPLVSYPTYSGRALLFPAWFLLPREDTSTSSIASS